MFTVVLAFLAIQGSSQNGQSGILVDDFQSRSSLARWQFSNGAEFPGASGSLSSAQGYSGQGAKLSFKINCAADGHCGHYVAAYRALTLSRDAQLRAISLWAKLPLEMRLVIRVEDETGQTLQYVASTPTMEVQQANAWMPVLVALDAIPNDFWGGANNGCLNGRITRIGILADSRNAVPSNGSLSFDEIWLLESALTRLDLRSSTRIIAVPNSTVSLSDRMGVNVHAIGDEEGLDSARSAGFSFVRTDLLWAQVEKNGVFDFSPYDRLLSSLEARGMGVLWILDYGHPDHGGAQPHSGADIAAYARYAREAAAHFGGHNVKFEIWNEPNLPEFLPDPRVYPELLNRAIAAIRAVDSTVTVTVGGISGVDPGFLANPTMGAPEKRANAIAVHPYRTAPPETLLPDLMLLRRFVDGRLRRNMPIWDTEWGYSSFGFFPVAVYGDGHADSACMRQAVLATRCFLTALVLGTPVAVWYDLQDDGSKPVDRESNFGLIDQQGNDKISMGAVRVLTGAARDHTLTGMLADVPPGVHAVELRGDSDRTVVVWCDQPNETSQVRFRASDVEYAMGVFGQQIPMKVSSDKTGTVMLTEADGPVYLHFRTAKS